MRYRETRSLRNLQSSPSQPHDYSKTVLAFTLKLLWPIRYAEEPLIGTCLGNSSEYCFRVVETCLFELTYNTLVLLHPNREGAVFQCQHTACMARSWFLRKIKPCQDTGFKTFSTIFGPCSEVNFQCFKASFCKRNLE